MKKKKFIVASASPRRKELLLAQGFDFEVVPSDANENIESETSAYDTVKQLSKLKAESVCKKNPGAVVLGCDTVVAQNEKVLGKPSDESEAAEMLMALSGKTHHVYTGVYITDGEKSSAFVSEAEVEFFSLSDETIESYIATGEPMDKAGAYGIQGRGAVLVKRISGDYFTIVGLPVARCVRELAAFGIEGKVKVKEPLIKSEAHT